MSKKKNIIIISISTILLIGIIIFLIINNNNSSHLKKINYETINKMIENKETFSLLISRTTCSHCQEFKPKLQAVANSKNITIYYIDIDKETKENQDNFKKIISFNGETPTTIFIKDGEETTSANRIIGNNDKSDIIKKLKANKVIN